MDDGKVYVWGSEQQTRQGVCFATEYLKRDDARLLEELRQRVEKNRFSKEPADLVFHSPTKRRKHKGQCTFAPMLYLHKRGL